MTADSSTPARHAREARSSSAGSSYCNDCPVSPPKCVRTNMTAGSSTVGDTEAVGVTVPVEEALAVALAELVEDVEAEREADEVMLLVGVNDAVPVTLLVVLTVAAVDLLVLGAAEVVPLTEGVACVVSLAVAVGEIDAGREAEADKEVEGLLVVLLLGVSEAVGLGLPLSEAVGEGEELSVAEEVGVARTVPLGT